MKKDKTYKLIKKKMVKELRAVNKSFDTDSWLQPGRYTTRLLHFECQRSLDSSYPHTNSNIPFYFYEAIGFVELIDWFNPLNNLVVRLDGWGDNATRISGNKEDNLMDRITISYTHGFGWGINSWLQYCQSGHVSDSPSNVDKNCYRNNPTYVELPESELSYLANLLEDYINNKITTQYIVGSEDPWKEKFCQGFYFNKKYIVIDETKELLYGIVGDRYKTHLLNKHNNSNPYYLLIRDDRLQDRLGKNGRELEPYAKMRSIYFEDKTKLFEFLDRLSDDARSQLELMLAMEDIYRDV